MEVFETKVKQWGNSMGIILPKTIADGINIHENDKIKVFVIKDQQKVKLGFGMLKGKLKGSAQEMKDELRRELYSE